MRPQPNDTLDTICVVWLYGVRIYHFYCLISWQIVKHWWLGRVENIKQKMISAYSLLNFSFQRSNMTSSPAYGELICHVKISMLGCSSEGRCWNMISKWRGWNHPFWDLMDVNKSQLTFTRFGAYFLHRWRQLFMFELSSHKSLPRGILYNPRIIMCCSVLFAMLCLVYWCLPLFCHDVFCFHSTYMYKFE